MTTEAVTIQRIAFERLQHHWSAAFFDMPYLRDSLRLDWVDKWAEHTTARIRNEILAMEEEYEQDVEMQTDHYCTVTLSATWWDHLKSTLPLWLRKHLRVNTTTFNWPLQIKAVGTVRFKSKTLYPYADIPYDRGNGSPYVTSYIADFGWLRTSSKDCYTERATGVYAVPKAPERSICSASY